MLADAIDAYLDSVSERAFYEPLLALLRGQGFTDVHLVHGTSEFGKDIIGKRDGLQWALQAKAGNISQPAFRGMTGQLDELRRYGLSHPSFDKDAKRQCCLVCTGRLTGNAPLSAQQYDEYAREHDEPGLTVWDRDELQSMLLTAPGAALRGSSDGQLLALLGSVASEEVDMDRIERFSRRWTEWGHSRLASTGVIELSIAAEALKEAHRLDLACQLTLTLVRAAWAAGDRAEGATVVADAAGAIFESYAQMLLDLRQQGLLEAHGLLLTTEPFANCVTYPVRAVRTAEFLALLALRLRERDDEQDDQVSGALSMLVANHPGCACPLGDRYAASIVPVALALRRQHPIQADELLRHAAKWLGDRYQAPALGLASEEASPAEEAARVFMSPEHAGFQRRRESYLAAVLLDLAAALRLPELYEDIHNELLAVDAVPTLVLAEDVPGQYLRDGQGARRAFPIDYAEVWPPDGTPVARHHHETADAYELGRRLRIWDQLALQAVLRDRHRVAALAA